MAKVNLESLLFLYEVPNTTRPENELQFVSEFYAALCG